MFKRLLDLNIWPGRSPHFVTAHPVHTQITAGPLPFGHLWGLSWASLPPGDWLQLTSARHSVPPCLPMSCFPCIWLTVMLTNLTKQLETARKRNPRIPVCCPLTGSQRAGLPCDGWPGVCLAESTPFGAWLRSMACISKRVPGAAACFVNHSGVLTRIHQAILSCLTVRSRRRDGLPKAVLHSSGRLTVQVHGVP